jgi:hypothetical protein
MKYTLYIVMTQNEHIKYLFCSYCNYKTNRVYNLIRHQNNKHIIILSNEECLISSGKNVHRVEENVPIIKENVPLFLENVPLNQKNENCPNKNLYNCKKCNKYYKTKKYLIQHEKICKGIDELTCPRCMTSFTSRQHKSRHILNNNCKPRSIIYARKKIYEREKKIEYNVSNVTINNITNNTNNVTNNIINYGNERIDYLNYEKMLEIFKKRYDIPSLLTKEIHFNKQFPENNNILYKNHATALIKKEDEFILKDLNSLANELIKEKTYQMQKFAMDNKDDICLKMDTYLYEDIIELLLNFILLKEPLEYYKEQIKNIKDIIKNNINN